jgi:hypothetical protein
MAFDVGGFVAFVGEQHGHEVVLLQEELLVWCILMKQPKTCIVCKNYHDEAF